jgi:hypothetical protein
LELFVSSPKQVLRLTFALPVSQEAGLLGLAARWENDETMKRVTEASDSKMLGRVG